MKLAIYRRVLNIKTKEDKWERLIEVNEKNLFRKMDEMKVKYPNQILQVLAE